MPAPPASGEAWLICEFARGEFAKSHGRAAAIDRLETGGVVIDRYKGVGGAAFLVRYGK